MVFEELALPESDDDATQGTAHLLLMWSMQWLPPVSRLTLHADLFDDAKGGDAQLALRAVPI